MDQPISTGARARSVDVDLRLTLDGRAGPVWRADSAERPNGTWDEITGLVESLSGRAGALLLEGRGLLMRDDLPNLLREIARIRPEQLGICTGGAGLSPVAARTLRKAGVRRASVPICSARQDANDWLMRKPGALKIAGRTIRALLEAEIAVVAEILVTRPTVRQLAETIAVLARLEVPSVVLRRLAQVDVEGAEFVPLSPRMDLLADNLEKAAAVALERRMSLIIKDFPLCASARLSPLFASAEGELWIAPDGTILDRSPRSTGCAVCPQDSRCGGAPIDYVARFGWEEFADERDLESRVGEDVEQQQALSPSAAMAFSWGSPRRVRCDACAAGAPLGGLEAETVPESTRAIRARLVEAARYRPAALRLVGADLLAHPEAAKLLYDAVRLFPRVEVAAEASPVVDWSDLDLRRLRELGRFDAALYGPDAAAHDAHCGIPGAFAATMRAIERLRDDAGIEVGAYAVLHEAADLSGFAAAWSDGSLPGTPRIRLSHEGGSLDDLLEAAAALPAGGFRDALEAVLPHCAEAEEIEGQGADFALGDRQQVVICGRSVEYRPCGSDPFGTFDSCREGEEVCKVDGCPGVAVGWRSSARTRRWTVNT